ncbi:MAG: hypothetical protein KAI74_06050, partial [Kiritimatiellae bacterium]|nr:hypothetical protein [Kiritimatiellia bacterium]
MTTQNRKHKTIKFIEQQNLILSSTDAETILNSFLNEMKLGLAGAKSSLAMIPTFINVAKPLPVNKPVIV